MKKTRKEYFKLFNGFQRKSGFYFLIMAVFSLLIITYSLVNMMKLKNESAETTIDYVDRFTNQITWLVSKEINKDKSMLMTIADSIGRFGHIRKEQKILDFIERKKEICGFDSVVYFEKDTGRIVISGELPQGFPQDVGGLEKLETIKRARNSKEGEVAVGLEDHNAVYATSLYSKNQEKRVLFGIDLEKNIQQILISKNFPDEMYNCILNKEGKNILTAADKQPFSDLRVLFKDAEEEKNLVHFTEMEKNIKNGKSGTFSFSSVQNKKLYFSYTPMEVNDWIMISIVPMDLFTNASTSFVLRALLSVIGSAAAFLSVFVLFLKNYNANRKELEKIAFSDEVTGGMNNVEFQFTFQKMCSEQDPADHVIVLLDVADFKEVNERFGIAGGNEMLRYFYEVMKKHLHEEEFEFVSRSEADHFFLCMKEKNEEVLQKRLDRMIEDINTFNGKNIEEYEVTFRQSGCFVENGKDTPPSIYALQDQARLVMKEREKESLNQCVFFNTSVAEKKQWERDLDKWFEQSIEREEFQLYLQPKVSLSQKKVVGGEALVRWNHPEKGIVSPAKFIPILEASGKIRKLDRYVFEKTCQWLDKRKREGKELFPISVNLSRNHFLYSDFVEVYADMAKKYQVDKSLIEFELTESIFLDDSVMEKVKKGLRKMREYGFKISIDDFGMGYSSLSLLKDFDVDVLKMDRSFFMDLTSKKSRGIISCLISLAGELDIQAVVEGIETQEQIDYLAANQYDVVQGYYFSPPLNVPEFEAWIDRFEKENRRS